MDSIGVTWSNCAKNEKRREIPTVFLMLIISLARNERYLQLWRGIENLLIINFIFQHILLARNMPLEIVYELLRTFPLKLL